MNKHTQLVSFLALKFFAEYTGSVLKLFFFLLEEKRRSEELDRMAVIAIPPIPPPSDLYSLPAMIMIVSVRGTVEKYC